MGQQLCGPCCQPVPPKLQLVNELHFPEASFSSKADWEALKSALSSVRGGRSQRREDPEADMPHPRTPRAVALADLPWSPEGEQIRGAAAEARQRQRQLRLLPSAFRQRLPGGGGRGASSATLRCHAATLRLKEAE
ncbi:unnamed protein product, partial [Polarella glacialis]